MVNFSANNLRFIDISIDKNLSKNKKTKYNIRYRFVDMNTSREYTFFHFVNDLKFKYNFDKNKLYVLSGKINVVGYSHFLVIENMKIDKKNNITNEWKEILYILP